MQERGRERWKAREREGEKSRYHTVFGCSGEALQHQCLLSAATPALPEGSFHEEHLSLRPPHASSDEGGREKFLPHVKLESTPGGGLPSYINMDESKLTWCLQLHTSPIPSPPSHSLYLLKLHNLIVHVLR